jgi:hypothetical protein
VVPEYDQGMLRVLVAVAAVGAAAGGALAAGGSGGPATAQCGDWAAVAQGRPAGHTVSEPGYRVWHGGGTWHVRTVTPADHGTMHFRGRITTERAIRRARPRGTESNDEVSRARRRIAFDVRTRGGDADGVDFRVRCGSVRFKLRPRSRPVSLGAAAAAAPAHRFTAPDPRASGVRGRVVTGPTCPVETAGEDCAPRPIQTTVDAFLVDAAGGEPTQARPDRTVATDSAGRFQVELAPGRYRVVPHATSPAASGKPEDITVTEGLMTDVTLTVDSGLR